MASGNCEQWTLKIDIRESPIEINWKCSKNPYSASCCSLHFIAVKHWNNASLSFPCWCLPCFYKHPSVQLSVVLLAVLKPGWCFICGLTITGSGNCSSFCRHLKAFMIIVGCFVSWDYIAGLEGGSTALFRDTEQQHKGDPSVSIPTLWPLSGSPQFVCVTDSQCLWRAYTDSLWNNALY